VEVVVAHLLIYAGADQLSYRDALAQEIKRESFIGTAEVESRIILDRQRPSHRYHPSSKPSPLL
jgi:hypothetical protein